MIKNVNQTAESSSIIHIRESNKIKWLEPFTFISF